MEIQEAMRCNDVDRFQSLLRGHIDGVDSSALKAARKEAIELNLAKMAGAIDPEGPIQQKISVIEQMAEFAFSEPEVVCPDDASALLSLSKMLQILVVKFSC